MGTLSNRGPTLRVQEMQAVSGAAATVYYAIMPLLTVPSGASLPRDTKGFYAARLAQSNLRPDAAE